MDLVAILYTSNGGESDSCQYDDETSKQEYDDESVVCFGDGS